MTAAALHGPADDATLAAVQQDLGHSWTDDLLAGLRVSDGADRVLAAAVIPPFFIPSPAARIKDGWHLMTGISRDIGDPVELATLEAREAGAGSPHFLRSWVPIADDASGNLLFVDLRPGELHGCVCRWWRDDGFHQKPIWSGVAQMTTDVADALEGGPWAKLDLEPTVEDGVLRWVGTDG